MSCPPRRTLCLPSSFTFGPGLTWCPHSCVLQVRKLTGLGQKKAHLIEIQVNGGTTNDKVDFATKLFEKVSRGVYVRDVCTWRRVMYMASCDGCGLGAACMR